MIDVIRYLIRESARAEDPASPWVAASFAVGKVLGGALLVAASHFALLWWSGVVAGKVWVALGPLLVVCAWEARQEWAGIDTIWDQVFWSIGIAGTVLTFDEVAPGIVSPQPGPLFFAVIGLALALLAYIAPKVRRTGDAE